jgi:hypothetical protein
VLDWSKEMRLSFTAATEVGDVEVEGRGEGVKGVMSRQATVLGHFTVAPITLRDLQSSISRIV